MTGQSLFSRVTFPLCLLCSKMWDMSISTAHGEAEASHHTSLVRKNQSIGEPHHWLLFLAYENHSAMFPGERGRCYQMLCFPSWAVLLITPRSSDTLRLSSTNLLAPPRNDVHHTYKYHTKYHRRTGLVSLMGLPYENPRQTKLPTYSIVL